MGRLRDWFRQRGGGNAVPQVYRLEESSLPTMLNLYRGPVRVATVHKSWHLNETVSVFPSPLWEAFVTGLNAAAPANIRDERLFSVNVRHHKNAGREMAVFLEPSVEIFRDRGEICSILMTAEAYESFKSDINRGCREMFAWVEMQKELPDVFSSLKKISENRDAPSVDIVTPKPGYL